MRKQRRMKGEVSSPEVQTNAGEKAGAPLSEDELKKVSGGGNIELMSWSFGANAAGSPGSPADQQGKVSVSDLIVKP